MPSVKECRIVMKMFMHTKAGSVDVDMARRYVDLAGAGYVPNGPHIERSREFIRQVEAAEAAIAAKKRPSFWQRVLGWCTSRRFISKNDALPP